MKDGKDERQKKNGLIYTTTSADGRALALLSLSGSSKGEATLCWRLSVQKNPQRRRGAFPGVQHMGGVVDKGWSTPSDYLLELNLTSSSPTLAKRRGQ